MSERLAPPRITGFDYVRPLGTGGFADVFLYDQDMPRRRVAVKVISSPLAAARDRSAFDAEIDAMARLSAHPSIVAILQAGLTADGRPYLVMEYCPESMKERTRDRPAHLHTVLDAGVRLAAALETAHRADVLHRDIKPSNVLVSLMGRPVLTDFGIASWQGRDASGGATRAMSIPWAAPEVLTGETLGTVASEVWALAATLYSFAAGRSPFEADDASENTSLRMRRRIAQAVYTPIPGAVGYAPFDAVLTRAMSARPEQRYGSMREFGLALQEVQQHYGYERTEMDLAAATAEVPEAVVGTTHTDVPVPPEGVRRHAGQTARARARAARAAMSVDRDGVVADPPPTHVRAGLIGAGIGAATMLAIVAGARLLGWF